MDLGYLPVILALLTFALVIFFVIRSKSKTEDRLDDPNARESTLAADTPDTRTEKTPAE